MTAVCIAEAHWSRVSVSPVVDMAFMTTAPKHGVIAKTLVED
jgi:hypothetical protein